MLHAATPVARLRGPSQLRRLRYALPQGRTLPDDAWQARHRVLLGLLVLHAIGLPLFGLAEGYGLLHDLAHGAPVAVVAVLAFFLRRRRRVAAALVSLGLITCSALLVHIWGGVIEGHFHFFVMIVVLALYEDWVPFILAAAYVVIHHGLMGALDPHGVYNHPDAVAHPWKWAAIHGAFVTAAGIASVAAWRLNESVRAETGLAYRRARESEERFRAAFDEAPIGMVLARIDPEDGGQVLQVNGAMCEITAYPEDELLDKKLHELCYPDGPLSLLPLRRLLAGELDRCELESRYVRADGALVCGLINASVVRDGAGKAAYAIAQLQDITERKRAQEQLSHQALHDALTDLPNRRKLMDDLESALTHATDDEPLALLLFDLDGFKAYNDSFGHPAGDALLARIGHRLSAAIPGGGTGYRMGGDEFCVVCQVPPEGVGALVAEALDALTERGDAFTVTASYGSVLLPAEATTGAQALRLADQRMYSRKNVRGRASAGRQSSDVLLQVLTERSPGLGTHLAEVTGLCAAVAERLGLPEDQLTDLLHAASLHDVGKASIPDSILNKPGPLDEEEWAFMRRHPVIGERILSAAPALAQAAKLVRSSHERVDGRGYPDGLAGDDIPLGARIIAVCDAYDAMTSDRPYRVAMSTEGAVSELLRGAGTQFDPAVVEAFVSVIAERTDAPMAAS